MSTQRDTIFSQVSDVEYTTMDRLSHTWNQFVRAPMSILIHDWRSLLGLSILVFYFLVGTVGVMFYRTPTSGQGGERYIEPFQSWELPLGTDHMQHDVLALFIHATPFMLQMMLAGAIFTVVLGTAWGVTAGFVGGRTDQVMMTVSDIVMTIPGLPLILVLATFFSPRHAVLVGIIVVINSWAGLSRLIRSEVLSMRQLGYIRASKTMGLSTSRILTKDVIPGIMPYVAIKFVQASRSVIYASVALYFLGVLPFTSANWGVMLNLAYEQGALILPHALHAIMVPIVAIMLMSLGLTLLAQGADQMFNPRLRARHAGKTTSMDELD